MMKRSFGAPAALLLLGLANCASHEPKHRDVEIPKHLPTAMLYAYAAPDGSLTRAQMEAGLRRDFDKVDANHNGCLDESEIRVINEERWKLDASTASPLIDFKQNGCVDFDEYAATARSLFEQLDRDGTGKLTAQQLKPGSKPAQPAGTEPAGPGKGRQKGAPPPSGAQAS
jgi:hypothetical protein